PAQRYFRPRGWRRLCLFPWHRRVGSHVPYKSLVELRAAYMPDAARAVSGRPPSSSRRKGHPPVLTSPNPLSTLLQRFAYARLSQPCLPGSRPAEAITVFDSEQIVDVVFTDVQMPGAMDGLMLAHWVYEHHPGTKVLVTSGKGDAAVSSGLVAGDAFFSKP